MVAVRDLQPSDFNDLVECYSSYQEELKENPALGIPSFATEPSMHRDLHWFSGLCRKVAEGNTVVIVAEVDSQVVGHCEVDRVLHSPEMSHQGILGMAIRKEHRGKGVGTAMLELALQKCKGKFETIELSVFSTNDRAKKLYQRFHFESIGVKPRAIKRNGAYIGEEIMVLIL
jgi:RimJ/RimL family protein N-acetyltransferase